MRPNYFFNNPDELVNHILAKLPEDPGYLRLNLILYFLFASYTGVYNPENAENYELDYQPKFIADLTFTANEYEPQDYSTKEKYKNEQYQPKEYIFGYTQTKLNVKYFLDYMLDQIKYIDDFSLVDRARQDDAWINAYLNNDYKIMSRDDMILDYRD